MSSQQPEYPCPACGFMMFYEPPGSYFICRICIWEDDSSQLKFPMNRFGPNKKSLYEWQHEEALLKVPLEVKTYQGFERDPQWRPLRIDELSILDDAPESSMEYVMSLGNSPVGYYWLVDENED
ncbi:MAG: CPCC family cysteine-rich protein [Aggregatilineales bacterium]